MSQKFSAVLYKLARALNWIVSETWVPIIVMGVSQTWWHQIILGSCIHTTQRIQTCKILQYVSHHNIHVCMYTTYKHFRYLPCGLTAWPPARVLYGWYANKPSTTTQKHRVDIHVLCRVVRVCMCGCMLCVCVCVNTGHGLRLCSVQCVRCVIAVYD